MLRARDRLGAVLPLHGVQYLPGFREDLFKLLFGGCDGHEYRFPFDVQEDGRELIERQGCELLFLSAYSPDFSPIEEAFSKLKALLRQEKARTREALVEAMGRALDAVTPEDATGWFAHCGYGFARPS